MIFLDGLDNKLGAKDMLLDAWDAGIQQWRNLGARGMKPVTQHLELQRFQLYIDSEFDRATHVRAVFKIRAAKWAGLNAVRPRDRGWVSNIAVTRTHHEAYASVDWIEEV